MRSPDPQPPPVREASALARLEPALWIFSFLFAVAAAGLYYYQPFQILDGKVEPRLALRAEEAGSQMRIAWNPALAVVQQAQGGTIEILDGSEAFRFPVERDRLMSGRFDYTRKSDDVAVMLRLYKGGSESEHAVVRSIGAPLPPAGPELLGAKEQSRNRLEAVKKPPRKTVKAAKKKYSRSKSRRRR